MNTNPDHLTARSDEASAVPKVGCEGKDGLLRIHPENEACDVCGPMWEAATRTPEWLRRKRADTEPHGSNVPESAAMSQLNVRTYISGLPPLPKPDIWVHEDFGLGDVTERWGYSAEQVELIRREAVQACIAVCEELSADARQHPLCQAMGEACADRLRALLEEPK